MRSVALPFALAALALSCKEDPAPARPASPPSTATASAAPVALPPLPKAPPIPAAPAWLPDTPSPSDNPLTAEKALLGKQLFFDKRLSKDGSAACESCHFDDKGLADGLPLSAKVGGTMNTRHTPTLFNVAYNTHWYWDGRAPTLEKNVEAAWKGQLGGDPPAVAAALSKVPGYLAQFRAVFGGDPTPESISRALAAYLRTLRSGDSPWDRHEKGEKDAVGEEARRGFQIFREKAGCAACHAPPLYTDNQFHNLGIGYDKPEPDKGRGAITKDPKDDGAFKTPTLRSVSTHPPYFHDGRAKTLEEAVDYMLSGGIKNPNLDPKLKKVTLTARERDDLLAFLRALEAPPQRITPPELPR